MNPFFIVIFLISFNCYSIDKVIYGEDNRKDLYEVQNPNFLEYAKSTMAMIPKNLVRFMPNQEVLIEGNTLATESKLCSNEKFVEQPTSALCSGFLVADDVLVTAGHCITNQKDCLDHFWVFDYAYNDAGQLYQKKFKSHEQNVFQCKEIISRSQDSSTLNDYAVIKLDRSTNRPALVYRNEGRVGADANLIVIGHPSGLPTKVSDNAFVRKNVNDFYFQTNLDSFSGNSGSAVIDSNTGLVEGILVRGETDYQYDRYNKCFRPKYCGTHLCSGEDVTRITNLKGIIF